MYWWFTGGYRRKKPWQKALVCCDGTWNTPRTETNIFRTYRFLRERLGSPAEVTQKSGVTTCGGRAKDGTEVLLFYDRGVGTDWFSRLVGGGVGVGLSDNVRDAYQFLGHNFRPGSEIYVFGFSRGAYTARSLCGFVKAAGLLGAQREAGVARLHGSVRHRPADRRPSQRLERRPRARLAGGARRRRGGPSRRGRGVTPASRRREDPLHRRVRHGGRARRPAREGDERQRAHRRLSRHHARRHGGARRAGAGVDEKRGPYVPTLWTQAANAALLAGQSVLQVWFPGVHSDVGGGYATRASATSRGTS